MPAPYASKPSVSSFTSRSCALCTCCTYVQPSRLHHPRLSLHPTMHLRPTTQCTLLRTGTLRTTPVDCCSTHLRSTNTHSRNKRSYSGAALVPKTNASRCVGSRGRGIIYMGRPSWIQLGRIENVGRGFSWCELGSKSGVRVGFSAGVGAASVVELPAVPLPSR